MAPPSRPHRTLARRSSPPPSPPHRRRCRRAPPPRPPSPPPPQSPPPPPPPRPPLQQGARPRHIQDGPERPLAPRRKQPQTAHQKCGRRHPLRRNPPPQE